MMRKKDFPFFDQTNLIYLDSAATSQKPAQVIDAIAHFYRSNNANPLRGIYRLAEQATQRYEDARKSVATYIGAHPQEIIFTRSATESINAVALGWAAIHLRAGDEIVISELEHHSNLLPWIRVAKKTGAVLKYIPVHQDGTLAMEQIDTIITDRTRLVAITHSSNAIGTPVNVHAITARAKQVGARVLVDACQTAPRRFLDVHSMRCDFLVFSGHKMLGPTGIGVLYMRKDVQHEVEPFLLGGGMVFEADWHQYKTRNAPQKFEAGTMPFIQAMGLAAAIEYLQQHVSFDELKKHEANLCTHLIDELQTMKHIQVLGPIDQLKKEGHVVTFLVKNMHAHDVATYLDTKGICVRAGNFCAQPLMKKFGYDAAVRVSFYGYNTTQDVDHLLQALNQLVS